MENRFPCPCCGFLVYSSPADRSFDICPVCFWEDDFTQLEDPKCSRGANRVSLNEARENFSNFGASSKAVQSFVRAPLSFEFP
jgi:hypothetical protein